MGERSRVICQTVILLTTTTAELIGETYLFLSNIKCLVCDVNYFFLI